MRNLKYVLIATFFLFSLNSFAAGSVFLQKALPLDNYDQNSKDYWTYFIFTEEKPGVKSDEVLSPGCEVIVHSQRKTLPAGEYRIVRETRESPSLWDKRWRRSLELSLNSGSFMISCKTSNGSFGNPITNRYINKVGTGYLTVK
jgi:hypothetical protein